MKIGLKFEAELWLQTELGQDLIRKILTKNNCKKWGNIKIKSWSDSQKIAVLMRKNGEKRWVYKNENCVKVLSDSYKWLFW